MGAISITREGFGSSAGSHIGDNIDEWLKKKYAISQQRADTEREEVLAKTPLYQAQAQYYGGINAEEARRTLAMQPMWQAEARAKNAQAAGTESTNRMNADTYQQQKDAILANLREREIKGMAGASEAGSILNTLIQERNRLTGEENPLLARYDKEGLYWANPAVKSSDFSSDVLAEEPVNIDRERRRRRNYDELMYELAAPYTNEFNMW